MLYLNFDQILTKQNLAEAKLTEFLQKQNKTLMVFILDFIQNTVFC